MDNMTKFLNATDIFSFDTIKSDCEEIMQLSTPLDILKSVEVLQACLVVKTCQDKIDDAMSAMGLKDLNYTLFRVEAEYYRSIFMGLITLEDAMQNMQMALSDVIKLCEAMQAEYDSYGFSKIN